MTWRLAFSISYIALCLGLALTLATKAEGHSLVRCSSSQTAQKQLRCGELNTWHGTTALRFLHSHPKVGTRRSRRALGRAAAYLIRYGNRHTEEALGRMLPPIDSCLRQIIRYEGSGFVPEDRSTWARAATRTNPTSGAYGVPQALPGSKMASHGADWRTNVFTQIRWMISYVNARYGGSCAALAHHHSAGYY